MFWRSKTMININLARPASLTSISKCGTKNLIEAKISGPNSGIITMKKGRSALFFIQVKPCLLASMVI